MLKMFVTSAIVSKGYEGAAAIRFSESGDSCRFRIGVRTYDKRAENNTRWINISVKAFGAIRERIEKMQMKESSSVNISGRLDEDTWEDPTTHEKRSAFVLIADDVEYSYSTNGKKGDSEVGSAEQYGADAPPLPQPDDSSGFTGNEPFGGENPLY